MQIPKHKYIPVALEVLEVRDKTSKKIRQLIRRMVGLTLQQERHLLAIEDNLPSYQESRFTALKKIRALYLYFQIR